MPGYERPRPVPRPAAPTPVAAPPSLFNDPNSGNVYQWDARGWSPFSLDSSRVGREQEEGFRKTAALRQLLAISDEGSDGGEGNVPPRAQYDDSGVAAAEAAAFARAKDRVGQTAAGAVAAIKNQMAARNIRGSGIEGRQIASVVNAGQSELGDVSRDIAIQSAERARQVGATKYTGDITQRAQDIGANRRSERRSSVMGLWGALQGGRY